MKLAAEIVAVVILIVPLAVVFYLSFGRRVRMARRIGRSSAASGSGGRRGWGAELAQLAPSGLVRTIR
jgi:hypothetical protein